MEYSVYIYKVHLAKVSFKTNISLLTFCLYDTFIDVSEILKSPNVIVLLLISSFMSVNICSI